MKVEFLGLPGSGKTTIYNLLLKMLKKSKTHFLTSEKLLRADFTKDLEKNSSISKLILKSSQINYFERVFKAYGKPHNELNHLNSFILKNHDLYKLVLDKIHKIEADRVEKMRLMSRFDKTFAIAHLTSMDNQNPKLIIIDEGLVHRVVTLWGRKEFSSEKDLIARYFDLISLPDIVIHSESKPSLCNQRLEKRGYPMIFENLPSNEIENRLKIIEDLINYSLDLLASKGVKIIKISNENGKEDLYQSTLNFLNSITK